MGEQPPSTVAIALQETLALTTHSTAPIVPLPSVSQDAHGLHRHFSLAAPSAPVLEKMPFSSLVSTQPPRVDSMSSSIYPALPSSTVDASWHTMPMQSMPLQSAGVPYVSTVSQAAYASVAPSAPTSQSHRSRRGTPWVLVGGRAVSRGAEAWQPRRQNTRYIYTYEQPCIGSEPCTGR
jgi:hypothetical protein